MDRRQLLKGLLGTAAAAAVVTDADTVLGTELGHAAKALTPGEAVELYGTEAPEVVRPDEVIEPRPYLLVCGVEGCGSQIRTWERVPSYYAVDVECFRGHTWRIPGSVLADPRIPTMEQFAYAMFFYGPTPQQRRPFAGQRIIMGRDEREREMAVARAHEIQRALPRLRVPTTPRQRLERRIEDARARVARRGALP